MDFLAQAYEKVVLAVRTVPTIKNWIVVLLLLLIIMLVCLPIGFWCKFLEIKIPELSAIEFIRILISRFLFPCFAEELLFRVLILPGKNNHASITTQLVLVVLSITVYVASHPLNVILFYKRALKIFTNPFFLLSTSVLGISCTVTYIESGSIWTAVILHWIIVVTWLIVLGGYSKLGF